MEDFKTTSNTGLPAQSFPNTATGESTLWRTAINRILIGLVLSSITIRFFALDYVFPAIGSVLLLLGFRALRAENGYFKAGWIISVIQTAYLVFLLIIHATVWGHTIEQTMPATVLSCANLALTLLRIVYLWSGFRAVQRKTELPQHAGAVGALLVWFLALYVLGLLQFGTIIGIPLLIVYIFILRSIYKRSVEVDRTGYIVQPASERYSERMIVCTLLTVTLIGIGIGLLFFNRYPMQWAAADTAEQVSQGDVRSHLLALGFPQEVLDDLTAADLEACRGAVRVVSTATDHPINGGREVVEQTEKGTRRSTVYDVRELHITGVAVELPGDRAHWRLFHAFRWTVNSGFRGTEAIQVIPSSRSDLGWNDAGEITGRVLYTADNATYVSPYHSLGYASYPQSSFFGDSDVNYIFGEFSFPRKGENHRGYITYDIQETRADTIISSWIDYMHQRSLFQYPVQTAADFRMTASMLASDRVFITIQDALQFYPGDPDGETF